MKHRTNKYCDVLRNLQNLYVHINTTSFYGL